MKKLDPRLIAGLSAIVVLIVATIVLQVHAHRQHRPIVVTINPGDSVLDKLYPFVQSPNYNERPPSTQISCIVLHATGENTKRGVLQTFLDPHEHTSAHFVIARDGSVVQMVPIELRAWHAGKSKLDGVMGVNDYSIGIEMVNRDTGYEPYTKAQYYAVAKLIDQIRSVYPIPESRIVSHAEIALPHGRKSDPEGFSFARLHVCMAKFEPQISRQMAMELDRRPKIQKIAQAVP